MRITLLNQFYRPDVAPTGLYLHDLARVLVEQGHEVKVICSRRSYDGTRVFPRSEVLDGVQIVRLPATGFGRRGFLGKLADYASFYGLLLGALLFERKRQDLILSLTTPPYIGLLGKLAAMKHRCRHAHWIMDLYPDVMLAHGMARSGWFVQMLRKLTHYQFKGADRIFTLGSKMSESVSVYVEDAKSSTPKESKSGATDSASSRVHWFCLWSNSAMSPWPDEEPNPLRAERGWAADEVVFLYSGNMGLGHRFGEFLEAARQLGKTGPRWVFAGDGKRRAEIVAATRAMPGARIDVMDYAPGSILRAHLCSADVHLASLDSSWQGFMVPSKLQGSFAVGRPVLYVGGRDCETAVWILESGGGWVVDENDSAGLMEAIRQSLDPVERRKRGQAALAFARENFQMSTTCLRMARLLEGEVSASEQKQTASEPASALRN